LLVPAFSFRFALLRLSHGGGLRKVVQTCSIPQLGIGGEGAGLWEFYYRCVVAHRNSCPGRCPPKWNHPTQTGHATAQHLPPFSVVIVGRPSADLGTSATAGGWMSLQSSNWEAGAEPQGRSSGVGRSKMRSNF